MTRPILQEQAMIHSHPDERGSAMVMALGALAVLAVIAIVVVAVVVSEKRTSLSDYTSVRSFYSADAASEGGVNWLSHEYTPASVVDSTNHVYVASVYTTIGAQNGYKFNVTYITKRYRSGWSVEYKDYQYRVDASGQSAQQATAAIELDATRLYREGY
jgi:Tfp pilus assembly protein PilX